MPEERRWEVVEETAEEDVDATLPRAPIPGFARHKNANCDYATDAVIQRVVREQYVR